MAATHRAVTLFDLDCFAPLVQQDDFKLVEFDQCTLGATTKKPTMILYANAPMLSDLAGGCNHPMQRFVDDASGAVYFAPHQRTLGKKSADGSYMTKDAARYPYEMNVALAEAITESIRFLPQCVLVLFSGDPGDLSSLPDCLRALGVKVLAVDILDKYSQINDVADDAQWSVIMARIMAKCFSFVFAAPPCRTFSEARGVGDGPPALRDRENPEGFLQDTTLSSSQLQMLSLDNKLACRTAQAVSTMKELGFGVAIEQPKPWKHLVREVSEKSKSPPSLTELLSRIEHMQVTSKDRYQRLGIPGSGFANGFSEMLGANVGGSISAATDANPGLFELLLQWFWPQSGSPLRVHNRSG